MLVEGRQFTSSTQWRAERWPVIHARSVAQFSCRCELQLPKGRMYTDKMEFEWDEDKRLSNLEKHGVDFFRARLLFDGRDSLILPSPHCNEAR